MNLAGRVGALAALATLSCAVLGACTTGQVDAIGIPTERGGTLHVLLDRSVTAWDPQRIAAGSPDAAFAVRTFLRTLTAPAPSDPGFLPQLVGDLSTTTGQSGDGRTWTFPLVSDATWQDGRFVTCADIKYGVSRNFATNRLTGGAESSEGSEYARLLLNIPSSRDPSGKEVSAYKGPYSGEGQNLFDQAVSCDGQKITFHLKTRRFDFDSIVSLPAFAPYRQDQDTDRAGPLSVFSCGPYMLEGVWKPGQGGRFVRNRKWIAGNDPLRYAWPDVIKVEEALPTARAVQRLLDDQDEDRTAITWADVPPAMLGQLESATLAPRVTRPDSGRVDVLVANPSTALMRIREVRRALAMATDRTAYASAAAAPGEPTTSTLAHDVPARPQTGPPGISTTGDPAAARALLESAGVSTPVALRLEYPESAPVTRGLAALQMGWQKAGIEVTLVPRPSVPAESSGGADLRWSTQSGAWPSGSATLPALVSQIGDPTLTSAADAGFATANAYARNAAWASLDEAMVGAGDVVPLFEEQHVHIRGSDVIAYQENPMLSGLPDLAGVAVRH